MPRSAFGQRAIGVDQLANQMIDDERGVTDQLSIDLDVGNFPFGACAKSALAVLYGMPAMMQPGFEFHTRRADVGIPNTGFNWK